MGNRGIALILTLTLIILVVSIVLNLASMAWIDVSESAVFREKMVSKLNLISMLNFAMGVLATDRQMNNYDSLNDLWADRGELNKRFQEWADHEVDIIITDETGRLNINALVRPNGEYNGSVQRALLRLLRGPAFGLTDEQAQDILDAIKDWIDKDDEPTRFGAESSYYKEQGLERGAKNGPLDFLEELLMVKGVNEALFYGKEGRAGLRDFLRLRGTERVNINTAPAEILQALGENVPWESVEALLEYRKDPNAPLNRTNWYKNVAGMAGVELDPALITVRSELFRAVLNYRGPTKNSFLIALLERTDKQVKVLEWKIE